MTLTGVLFHCTSIAPKQGTTMSYMWVMNFVYFNLCHCCCSLIEQTPDMRWPVLSSPATCSKSFSSHCGRPCSWGLVQSFCCYGLASTFEWLTTCSPQRSTGKSLKYISILCTRILCQFCFNGNNYRPHKCKDIACILCLFDINNIKGIIME